MTDPAPLKTFPSIQGRCPACRGDSLFIGSGGYVTCSRLDCPNPSAADEMLHGSDRLDASWQPQDDGSWTLDIGAGRGAITMPRGTTMRERAQFAAAWEAMNSRPRSAATQATDGTVCGAYQPPTLPEDSGLCARCGMADWKHQPTPDLAADPVAAAFADILNTFSPLSSHTGIRIGWIAQHPIHPDDYDRWIATLHGKEQPGA